MGHSLEVLVLCGFEGMAFFGDAYHYQNMLISSILIIYIRDFDKRMVALKCGDVVLISIWFLNHTSHHPSSFHHEASILRASTVTIDNRYRKKTTSPCLEQAERFSQKLPPMFTLRFSGFKHSNLAPQKSLEIHSQGASFGVVAASNRWWWWMEEGSP